MVNLSGLSPVHCQSPTVSRDKLLAGRETRVRRPYSIIVSLLKAVDGNCCELYATCSHKIRQHVTRIKQEPVHTPSVLALLVPKCAF